MGVIMTTIRDMSAAGRSSGIGAGSMLAAARLDYRGARCRRGVGDAVGVE
jgi:hypothetical protein